jgi:hypothetical protein
MLPNVIIIGAMKAGTTSLHYYLNLHPDIFMSEQKELNFFVAERNWPKGLDWYRTQFASDAPVRGETSPNYTAHHLFKGIPARMHSVVPDAKLIYLVRDPIERMVSHYVHLLNRNPENRSLEEAFSEEDSNYYQRSKYYMQLQKFTEYYDKDSILVVSNERLRGHRRETLREIFRFLGVDENFDTPDFDQIKHDSGEKRKLNPTGRALLKVYRGMRKIVPATPALKEMIAGGHKNPLYEDIKRPMLSPELRAKIAVHLADDVAQLRAYTGRSFSEWSL